MSESAGFTVIRTKYAGYCVLCRVAYSAGTEIVWVRSRNERFCIPCARKSKRSAASLNTNMRSTTLADGEELPPTGSTAGHDELINEDHGDTAVDCEKRATDGALVAQLTVSQVTNMLARTLKADFSRICVVGEVTDFGLNRGHWYFTLKDSKALLNAICFKMVNHRFRFVLENGLKILAYGSIEIYPPQGRYSLKVDRIDLLGEGAFQLAFNQLKAKLSAEGLLDEKFKRQIPKYPRRVALVTSKLGAALQDMLAVLRSCKVHILICDVKVQGDGADKSIANALRALQNESVDIIVIARGGGSKEDLNCFNSETLARAIRASAIPVISGVGHETDWTICDLAADMRVPTPTAAAEKIAKSRNEIVTALSDYRERLLSSAQKRIDNATSKMDKLRLEPRLNHWLQKISIYEHNVDRLKSRMITRLESLLTGLEHHIKARQNQLDSRGRQSLERTAIRLAKADPRTAILRLDQRTTHLLEKTRQLRAALEQAGENQCLTGERLAETLRQTLLLHLEQKFSKAKQRTERANPLRLLPLLEERLTRNASLVKSLNHRLERATNVKLNRDEERLARVLDKLRALGPSSVLLRGFAILQHKDKSIIRSAEDARAGDELTAILGKGKLRLLVLDVEQNYEAEKEQHSNCGFNSEQHTKTKPSEH